MIALATGCRSLPFPDPQLEGVYGKELKKWTRSVAVYSGLETRAFVRMVYLSPEFVAAQALELARMRAEPPEAAAAHLARLREQYRQPTFFAVTYIPEKSANDWGEPDSVWRIALDLGAGEVPVQKVQRFERPFNAELHVLYPYLDEYSTGYLVQFPEQALPGGAAPVQLSMVVAGAEGIMRFYWRLDGGPEPRSEGEGGPPQKPVESPKP